MTYLKVMWNHNFENEPVELLSEMDADRNEIRKIERFRNGALSFTGPHGASGSTYLSDVRIPDFQELSHDPEFYPMEIDRHTFGQMWRNATLATAA